MATQLESGTILFASDTTPEAIQEARAYISHYALTSDQVRLIKTEDQVKVIAKCQIYLTSAPK